MTAMVNILSESAILLLPSTYRSPLYHYITVVNNSVTTASMFGAPCWLRRRFVKRYRRQGHVINTGRSVDGYAVGCHGGHQRPYAHIGMIGEHHVPTSRHWSLRFNIITPFTAALLASGMAVHR